MSKGLPGSTAGDTPSDLEWVRVWRAKLKIPKKDLKVVDWMIEKLDRATWLLLEAALKDVTSLQLIKLTVTDSPDDERYGFYIRSVNPLDISSIAAFGELTMITMRTGHTFYAKASHNKIRKLLLK